MIFFKRETCNRKINLQTQNLAKYRYMSFCLYFIYETCGIQSLRSSASSDHVTDVISFASLCSINDNFFPPQCKFLAKA